jgi:hypothetical protein
MSEMKTDENKKIIKELAAWMDQRANDPRVTDEELEQLVGGLADAHKLDTAANGCPT